MTKDNEKIMVNKIELKELLDDWLDANLRLMNELSNNFELDEQEIKKEYTKYLLKWNIKEK